MQSQADVTRLTPVASLFRKLFIIVFEIKGSMSVVGASILGGIRDVSRVERRAVRGTCAGERKGILSVAVDLIDIPAVFCIRGAGSCWKYGRPVRARIQNTAGMSIKS